MGRESNQQNGTSRQRQKVKTRRTTRKGIRTKKSKIKIVTDGRNEIRERKGEEERGRGSEGQKQIFITSRQPTPAWYYSSDNIIHLDGFL